MIAKAAWGSGCVFYCYYLFLLSPILHFWFLWWHIQHYFCCGYNARSGTWYKLYNCYNMYAVCTYVSFLTPSFNHYLFSEFCHLSVAWILTNRPSHPGLMLLRWASLITDCFQRDWCFAVMDCLRDRHVNRQKNSAQSSPFINEQVIRLLSICHKTV